VTDHGRGCHEAPLDGEHGPRTAVSCAELVGRDQPHGAVGADLGGQHELGPVDRDRDGGQRRGGHRLDTADPGVDAATVVVVDAVAMVVVVAAGTARPIIGSTPVPSSSPLPSCVTAARVPISG